MVWEALASYVYPCGVKKKPVIFIYQFFHWTELEKEADLTYFWAFAFPVLRRGFSLCPNENWLAWRSETGRRNFVHLREVCEEADACRVHQGPQRVTRLRQDADQALLPQQQLRRLSTGCQSQGTKSFQGVPGPSYF